MKKAQQQEEDQAEGCQVSRRGHHKQRQRPDHDPPPAPQVQPDPGSGPGQNRRHRKDTDDQPHLIFPSPQRLYHENRQGGQQNKKAGKHKKIDHTKQEEIPRPQPLFHRSTPLEHPDFLIRRMNHSPAPIYI